jgi:hypothetical protein
MWMQQIGEEIRRNMAHLELGLLVELPTLVDRPIQMNSYSHRHHHIARQLDTLELSVSSLSLCRSNDD